MEDVIVTQGFQARGITLIASIEQEKLGSDQTVVRKIADIIAVLPNLEA